MKNNNKKVSYKLAKQSLKASKMRNVFTLITIILSVGLLAGLAFADDAIDTEYKRSLEQGSQVIFENISVEQIQQLKNDKAFSSSTVLKRGNSFEIDNYILMPFYIENIENSMSGVEIVEGEYPTKFNQVIVDKQLMDFLGKDVKLGEQIEISFLDGSVETFEVSGFLENEKKLNVFGLYLSKDYSENGNQLKNVSYEMAAQILKANQLSKEEFLERIRSIGAQYGIEQKNVNPNDQFADSLNYDFAQLWWSILGGIAILIVSVIVIYSIFYISITERTRQFGQLRTIGMTKKQIKKMVRYEGTILSIIGTTIGICIGALFAYVIRPNGFDFIHVLIIIVSIFIADFITVRISIVKPAKIASNISPIEAMKQSGYETKKHVSRKLHRKLSAISLSLIAANGNRKKSLFTIISLCLAGITFMAASTFVYSMNEVKFASQGWLEYGEYVFDLSSNAASVNEYGYTGIKQTNPINDTLIEEIKSIDGVKDVMIKSNLNLTYTYNGEKSDDLITGISKEEIEALRTYCTNPNINYDTMISKKEVYIINNNIMKEIYGWKFKIGDSIKLRWFNGERYVEDSFTIAGELNNDIYNHLETFHMVFNTGWFIGADKMITDMMISGFNLNNLVVISSENYEKYGASIENHLDIVEQNHPSLSLETLKKSMERHKDDYASMTVIFMALACFVIAFSIINLANTLISNVAARKREFACLRTLGMTQKQVSKMIQGEGLYLAFINIICTSTIGSLVGYLVVQIFISKGIRYLEFQFPWIYLLCYMVIVFVIPMAISYVSIRKMNQKSLIEEMRETE